MHVNMPLPQTHAANAVHTRTRQPSQAVHNHRIRTLAMHIIYLRRACVGNSDTGSNCCLNCCLVQTVVEQEKPQVWDLAVDHGQHNAGIDLQTARLLLLPSLRLTMQIAVRCKPKH